MQGSASMGARADMQQHGQAPAQQKSPPMSSMHNSRAAMPHGAAAAASMEQRRGTGAGPFGPPLQGPPQDVEANLSDMFGGQNGGWKKSGWRGG